MKAEDKFYFGKPDVMATPMGEHGVVGKLVSRAIREGAEAYRAGKPAVLNARDPKYKGMSAKELEVYGNFWMRGWDGERIKDASAKPTGRGLDLPGMRFSRPGEPERFAAYGEVNTAAVNREARKYLETLNRVQPDEAHKQLYSQLKQRLQRDIQETQQAAERVKKGSDHPYDFWRISDLHRSMIEAGRYSQEAIRVMSRWIPDAFSRPGQPDKFDASSLNRGTFAEASTSPMLGKLLSEKVMPEGGWRAVETGGGALVISFEDADLARDFGRRVATKGYNATSPVQAIGRYWNVEVKNG